DTGRAGLVDETGSPVQLRGMSTHGIQWFDELYTEDALRALAEHWKADVLRISLYAREGGYAKRSAYYTRRVDELVQQATQNGLYVIIDWHQLTPGDPNADKENAKTFFAHMAEKHGAKENVIFEICNEPNDVGEGDWISGESAYDVTWDEHIKPYAEEIIPIIREHSDNIIIVGTPKWASRPNDVIGNPLDDTNVMYTLHFYAGSHTYKKGDDKWHYMDNMREAIRAGLAVFVTEFGTQTHTGDAENDFAASRHWLDSLAKYNVSWCNWNYSDDSRSGAVFKEGAVGPWSSAKDFADPDNMKEAGRWIFERIRNPGDGGYTIQLSAPAGVQFSPAGPLVVSSGEERTVAISTEEGYVMEDVLVNGVSRGNIDSYTFENMRGDSSLTVRTRPVTNHELLENGSFTDGEKGWAFHAWGSGSGTGDVSGGAYQFTVNRAGENIWDFTLLQRPVALQKDRLYRLSWQAASPDEKEMLVTVQKPGEPYTVYHNARKTLADTSCTFVSTFVMNHPSDPQASIQLQSGSDTGTALISSVSLVELIDSGLVLTGPEQESCAPGDTLSLSWRSTDDIAEVMLWYATDSTEWQKIAARPSDGGSGSFAWTVPALKGEEIFFRAQSAAGRGPSAKTGPVRIADK
ncbi:MAG: cellulase family glycosylhydrolase, partial [Fibrobacterota bacterium]